MGMQSFRGAGGVGAFSTPVAKIDSDSLGEGEPRRSRRTRSPTRNNASNACSSAWRPSLGTESARSSSPG